MSHSDFTAVHTVLQIPELVELIVDQLSEGNFPSRRTLARLSRVSTAFHEPAIRNLWSSSAHLLPELLRIFLVDQIQPRKQLRLGPEGFPGTAAGFDWTRFQRYSFYVTWIHLRSELYRPSSIALLGTRNSSPNTRLFPRLETLEVCHASVRDYPNSEWMMLAGPSLRKLALLGGDDANHRGADGHVNLEAAFTSFCLNLPQLAPNLQHLTLDHFPNTISVPPAALTTALCQTLQSFTTLQTFEFLAPWRIPSDLVSCIAAHPSIRQIALGQIIGLYPRRGKDEQLFGSLEKLRLRGDMASIWEFVKMIPRPALLKEVKVLSNEEVSRFPSQSPFPPEAFLSFSRLWHTSTNLTCVVLESNRTFATWAQFQPLLNTRTISIFSVYPDLVGLDNEALVDIASAWRDLEDLKIPPVYQRPLHYHITLLGLTPLARLCLNLKRLKIGMTTRTSEQDLMIVTDPSPGPNCCLSSLDVCYSEINEEEDSDNFLGPQRTAIILASLWPTLRRPNVSLGSGWSRVTREYDGLSELVTTMAERWRMVKDLLKEMES